MAWWRLDSAKAAFSEKELAEVEAETGERRGLGRGRASGQGGPCCQQEGVCSEVGSER